MRRGQLQGGDLYREFRALRKVAGKDARFVSALAELLSMMYFTAEKTSTTLTTLTEEYARNHEEFDRLSDHGFSDATTIAALQSALACIEQRKPYAKKL